MSKKLCRIFIIFILVLFCFNSTAFCVKNTNLNIFLTSRSGAPTDGIASTVIGDHTTDDAQWLQDMFGYNDSDVKTKMIFDTKITITKKKELFKSRFFMYEESKKEYKYTIQVRKHN